MKSFKFLVVILTFEFLVLNFTHCATAVEIDPMRIEYSLEAGKNYSGGFQLKNSSNMAVDIFVSTGEYRYIFSPGTIPPQDQKSSQLPSCRDWFKFEKTKFSLNPGESAEAKFIINMPKDASSEHLCAVLFDEKRGLQQAELKEKTGNVKIELTPRFSIPVYISNKGIEKSQATITNLSTVSGSHEGVVIINITLENNGNIHIRPLGTLVIFNQGGEAVKNLPIGKSLPIFPGYRDTIPVVCPKLPAGKYTTVATVEISQDNIIQKKTSFTLTGSNEVK